MEDKSASVPPGQAISIRCPERRRSSATQPRSCIHPARPSGDRHTKATVIIVDEMVGSGRSPGFASGQGPGGGRAEGFPKSHPDHRALSAPALLESIQPPAGPEPHRLSLEHDNLHPGERKRRDRVSYGFAMLQFSRPSAFVRATTYTEPNALSVFSIAAVSPAGLPASPSPSLSLRCRTPIRALSARSGAVVRYAGLPQSLPGPIVGSRRNVENRSEQ